MLGVHSSLLCGCKSYYVAARLRSSMCRARRHDRMLVATAAMGQMLVYRDMWAHTSKARRCGTSWVMTCMIHTMLDVTSWA